MAGWPANYRIIGDTRVRAAHRHGRKDKKAKTPFDEAGKLIYKRAFSKGLAWIPAGHILRMSPPIVMPENVAQKGMDLIEESIAEVDRELAGR